MCQTKITTPCLFNDAGRRIDLFQSFHSTDQFGEFARDLALT